MSARPKESLWRQFAIQRRVIWALVMRESITMYGREGLGALWLIAEPIMFIVGVMFIFSLLNHGYPNGVTEAEYLAVSYPTLMFWRNGTGRVVKAIDINRSLLHHQNIRPIDIIYARIILTFASGAAAFMTLYPIITFLGITHLPAHWFAFAMGYLLVIWFSFAFVMIMAALAELSEAVERTSHIIIYLMLPVSGVFFPAYVVPQPYRDWLLLFPLVDCVEYFHYGYFGSQLPTYHHLPYTLFMLLAMTLFAYGLTEIAIRRARVYGGG